MKWRCAYCGKPHERNDPPCDNCGNNEFEKAVVPMAPEAEDEEEATSYVWVCTECGNDHPKNTPPCDRCGSGPLERREQTYDEEEILNEMLDDGDGSAPSADVGYLDVLDGRLVGMFVGVGVLVTVLALGFLGVVNVPGISPIGPPPGEATSVAGLSLADVEDSYVDELNERRSEADTAALARSEGLNSAATHINQERVRAEYGSGEGPDPSEVQSDVASACGESRPVLFEFRMASNLGQADPAEFETERELALALLDSPDAPDVAFDVADEQVGVDVHVAPDGTVYVAQLAC